MILTDLDIPRAVYAVQDRVLQYVSREHVSINKKERKIFMENLGYVLDEIERRMKSEDLLFKETFQKRHVAGSFWDGLKVGKPEEFDVNYIIKPPFRPPDLEISDALPSFVKICSKQHLEMLTNTAQKEKIRKYGKWLDSEGFISAEGVRTWMESVLDKALSGLPKRGKLPCLERDGQPRYKLYHRKSGPAMTLKVSLLSGGQSFNVDIVPAFEFQWDTWPASTNPQMEAAAKKPWFVVPKPYINRDKHLYDTRLWRVSFHDQESIILHNTYHLKNVIKLLKKLRDTRKQTRLSSYAIKTVFLWEAKEQPLQFWNNQLSVLFLYMLKKLISYLRTRTIPFYWNEKHNLLSHLKETCTVNILNNFSNAYEKIVNALEKRENLYIISTMMLTEEDEKKLEENIVLTINKNGKVVAVARGLSQQLSCPGR